MTARQCSRLLQKQIAISLPEICEGLLKRAKSGDVKCVKLLLEMADPDQKLSASKRGQAKDRGLAFARKVLAEFKAK